jgi:exosome complex RNA-binding protein Rrp42 (RNase PH superfamily)
LYCDLICLDDSGSVLDVAVLALSSALKTVRLPKVEYDMDTKIIKVDDKIRTPLNLKCMPVASTFMSFEDYLTADPTDDEEQIADSLITISTCDGKFNYIHQPGGNILDPAKFDDLVKHAVSREKYIKSLLNSI